ncbi:MAG: ATP-binding protein [Planctomycetes bacterium]|nr:ATP-binding protein [Planctomycetota bacterium]
MLLQCPYFTYSEKQRAARHRKYYPIDLGWRDAVITKGGADRGKSLEAVVLHHLRQHCRQVYHWRQGGEVDFVTLEGGEIAPYQVSWEGNKNRHREALE